MPIIATTPYPASRVQFNGEETDLGANFVVMSLWPSLEIGRWQLNENETMGFPVAIGFSLTPVLFNPGSSSTLWTDGSTLYFGALPIGGSGVSVTGMGAPGQVTYWTGTGTVAGQSGLLYDAGPNILTAGNIVRTGLGDPTSPSYSFFADSSSGLYAVGAGTLGLATSGVLRLSIGSTAVTSSVLGIYPAASNGASGYASIRLTPGVAPTTNITDGDVWITTAGMFARVNGSTVGPFNVGSGTIGGSATNTQVAYGVGGNNLGSDAGLVYISSANQLQILSSSVLLPAYSFSGDTDTGMYHVGANDLGFATNGILRLDISAAAITAALPLVLPAGSAALPSLTLDTDADTGIYWVGANDLGFATNGTLRLDISTVALTSTLIGVFPASAAGASGYASLRLPHGAAPTTNLTDGDLWSTTAGFFGRAGGATVGPFIDGSVLNASNLTLGTVPASAEPAHVGDVTNSAGSLTLTIATGAVTDTKASLANKPASTVVATTNQTLSGIPTIDSQLLADGSIVLNTAQTAPAENGPWVVHAGAWTRPTWYPAGGTTQAFQYITTLIRLGTTYRGSTWRMTTAGAITIDTTGTTWVVTSFALNSNTVTGTLPVAQFPANELISTVGVTVDGSGSVLTTGSKGFVQVQYAGTVTNWTVLAAGAGSIVVDVKRTTNVASPGSGASMVGAGNKPTLTSAQGATAAVSGWTSTAVAAGDVIEWNVDSVTSITRVIVEIQITRT